MSKKEVRNDKKSKARIGYQKSEFIINVSQNVYFVIFLTERMKEGSNNIVLILINKLYKLYNTKLRMSAMDSQIQTVKTHPKY